MPPFGIGMPLPPPQNTAPDQMAGVSAGAGPGGPTATGFSGENNFDPNSYTPPQNPNAPPDAMGLSTPEANGGGGWRSKIPLILAGLGAGVGAFTKGGLSDFGVGLASGFANEKYRGARQKEEDTHREKEQSRLLHLQQVEKIKDHMQTIRADTMDDQGHPMAVQAQKMFDEALANDKIITPKEAAQIEQYLRLADAKQHKMEVSEDFTQKKGLESQYSAQELKTKLQSGELVQVPGVGVLTPAQLMQHKDEVSKLAAQSQYQNAMLKLQREISDKKQDFTYEDATKYAAQIYPALMQNHDPAEGEVPSIEVLARQIYNSAHGTGSPSPAPNPFSGVTSDMTKKIQNMVGAGATKAQILAQADHPELKAKLGPIVDMFLLAKAKGGQSLPPPPSGPMTAAPGPYSHMAPLP